MASFEVLVWQSRAENDGSHDNP